MTLSLEELDRDVLGELRLRYTPVEPTAKQEFFLLQDALEVFFGGAAGPGKSWGLLMAALQYVDVPGYHALLLRPTLQEFEKPGNLIEVAHHWLGPTDAHWNGSRREWRFPSGSTVSFGYLRTIMDLEHYKGPSYSFVGFDELTSFTEQVYRGISRVLRQPRDGLEGVPVRKRAASNPGGPGHGWVKTRFIDPRSRAKDAVFVKALIGDNPHLDYDAYMQTLSHLSPVDRERLINGDWDVMEEGGVFTRDSFILVDPGDVPPADSVVRYWDLAATEPSASNPDPDWTVGLRLERDRQGIFTVSDIVRERLPSDGVEELVRETAEMDGPAVTVYVEQEPGASGKSLVRHFQRVVLSGFACHAGLPRGGDKEVRARPVSAAAKNHLVRVVRGRNVEEFLDEAAIFPHGAHDDCVDALSGGHTKLATGSSRIVHGSSAVGRRIPGVGV